MPFYEKGDVRIRYEEAGSGFPLLVTPGGGLNSRVSNWPTAVINAMEAFKNDFRCITMDQRNANGGESTGPVPVDDPWDAFADDQLGLMDHLGIHEFFYMGYCIGGCFAGKLHAAGAGTRRRRRLLPDRRPSAGRSRTVMYNAARRTGPPNFCAGGPTCRWTTIEHISTTSSACSPISCTACRATSSRNCRTPMLVLPDDTPAHPLQTSIDVASLAPNAEITVYPWKEPAGAEAAHDRPGAPLLEGASTSNSRSLSQIPHSLTSPSLRQWGGGCRGWSSPPGGAWHSGTWATLWLTSKGVGVPVGPGGHVPAGVGDLQARRARTPSRS